MRTFQQWLEARMDGMPIGREDPWFGCKKCGKRTEETRKNMISRLCDECEKKKVTESQSTTMAQEGIVCAICRKPAEVLRPGKRPLCKNCDSKEKAGTKLSKW
jgi:uncharacterized CHY-type Zn-finger protein